MKVIDTGISSAEKNMAIDSQLLEGLADNDASPILHLYEWKAPSATYGYFNDPYLLLDATAVERHGLELARRPTGGGIIFHVSDFAFSVLIPSTSPHYSVNTLENYAFINNQVIEVIRKFISQEAAPNLLPTEPEPSTPLARHFCMGKPTKYDIILDDKKVGGCAQRRTKHGFLHQGSISLTLPNINFLEEVLKDKIDVLEAMKQNTYNLISHESSLQDIAEARALLKQIMQGQFKGQ